MSDSRDAVVILEGDTAMLRLGEQDFVERIQGYIDLAPALRERVSEIDYVDLRFADRLYVRPVREGNKAGDALGGSRVGNRRTAVRRAGLRGEKRR